LTLWTKGDRVFQPVLFFSKSAREWLGIEWLLPWNDHGVGTTAFWSQTDQALNPGLCSLAIWPFRQHLHDMKWDTQVKQPGTWLFVLLFFYTFWGTLPLNTKRCLCWRLTHNEGIQNLGKKTYRGCQRILLLKLQETKQMI
jgi:hypothetical protein